MKVWKTLGASLLALLGWGLVVVMLFGCASYPPYTPVISLPMDASLGGITVCDVGGNPVVVMNDHYKNSTGRRFTLTHEMTHARQMREYKDGCHAFLREYTTSQVFRLKVEAEAMCAEVSHIVSEGGDFKSTYSRVEKFVVERFPEVENAVTYIPCKPGGSYAGETRQTRLGGLQEFREPYQGREVGHRDSLHNPPRHQ